MARGAIAFALMAAGVAASSFAQTPPAGTPGSLIQPRSMSGSGMALAPVDRTFIEGAARDGIAELALARLARRQAHREDVKQFAAMLENDHVTAHEDLEALARTRRLALPASLEHKHQRRMAALARVSGAAFDRQYLELMVDMHRKAVADFRRQARIAKDAGVRGYAAKSLPALERHLKEVQGLSEPAAR